MKASLRKKVSKRGSAKLLDQIRAMGGEHKVKIGFPKGSKPYPDTGISVINVALWNELGTRSKTGRVHVPARPFLRPGVRENTQNYVKLNKKNLAAIQNGDLTFDQALGQLGEMAVRDVKSKIREVSMPPKVVKALPKKHRNKTNPLILTGHMRASVTHQVVEGAGQGAAASA